MLNSPEDLHPHHSLFLTAITQSTALAFQISLAKTAADKAQIYLYTFCLSQPWFDSKSLQNRYKGERDEKKKKMGLSTFFDEQKLYKI